MVKNIISDLEKENLKQFISDIYKDSISNEDFYFIGPRDRMKAKRSNNLEKIFNNFIFQLENQEKDLYFTNQTFYYYEEDNKPRRKQKNIRTIRTFFVDIDKIEVNHLKTKEDMKEYLYNNYPFLKEIGIFPQYVVTSGHGLHLYFILSEAFGFVCLEDKQKQHKVNETRKAKWKELSLMLCKLFNSDSSVSCDISKILRLPYSYNMKDEQSLIRGNLFNYREEYKTLSYEELKAKIEPLISLDDKDNISQKAKVKTERKPKEYREQQYYYDENTINDIKEYYKNYTETSKYNRTFGNIIYFLEEVLLPNRNYDIEGYRHTYIFCIAKVYQNNKRDYEQTLEHCQMVNKSFIEPLTMQEIKDIVYYLYNTNNTFIYRGREVSICRSKLSNENIKNLLGITPTEQNLYHNISFYEEHRELKESILNEIKNNKHKENNIYYEKKNKKEEQFKVIENNPNATIKELMELMHLSKAQVCKLKKEYKERGLK